MLFRLAFHLQRERRLQQMAQLLVVLRLRTGGRRCGGRATHVAKQIKRMRNVSDNDTANGWSLDARARDEMTH